MDRTSVSLLWRLAHLADDRDWDRFVKLYTPLIYFWGRRQGLLHIPPDFFCCTA
jgi:RNA polymerase sigma-70 factor (ECF subfamily)